MWLDILVSELAEQTVRYTLLDALGRTLRTDLVSFDSQGSGYIPSVENAKVGLHFLRLQGTTKQYFTFKFIIQ